MTGEVNPEIRSDAGILWDYLRIDDPIKDKLKEAKISQADALLVHGSYSKQTALRAARVFRRGVAKRYVCTGERGEMTRDSEKTEAEVFQDIALLAGVRPEHILTEQKSTNTRQNYENGFSLCLDYTRSRKLHAILITLPWAGRRSLATAEKVAQDFDFELYPIMTCLTHNLDQFAQFNTPWERLIPSMRGEIRRLRDYGLKGDLITPAIPVEVIEANFRLAQTYSER